jgi:hypothetical protein
MTINMNLEACCLNGSYDYTFISGGYNALTSKMADYNVNDK